MTASKTGDGKGVRRNARPYEGIKVAWSGAQFRSLQGTGLTKTARLILMFWAGAEKGKPLGFTASQLAHHVDCHRRSAERALALLETRGYVSLYAPGNRALRLAAEYLLVRNSLPCFGDGIQRKRTSEAMHRRPVAEPQRAAKRRSPGSLRTGKKEKHQTLRPIASKGHQRPQEAPLPANSNPLPENEKLALESVVQDLKAVGLSEEGQRAVLDSVARGEHTPRSLRHVFTLCQWASRTSPNPIRNLAGYFRRVAGNPKMAADLSRKSCLLLDDRPVLHLGDQKGWNLVPDPFRSDPKFFEAFCAVSKWNQVRLHGDHPGFLEWLDARNGAMNSLVEHGLRLLGAQAGALQAQVSDDLQTGGLCPGSSIWGRAERFHLRQRILGASRLETFFKEPGVV